MSILHILSIGKLMYNDDCLGSNSYTDWWVKFYTDLELDPRLCKNKLRRNISPHYQTVDCIVQYSIYDTLSFLNL